jgi:hypothetical protein
MDIDYWVNHISQSRPELGGLPVCPFAKNSKVTIINTDGGDINPPPWAFDLIIYKLPDQYSIEELTDIATEYNNLYPEMVFLPDHKDKNTFINGVQTNNGQYNFILCQWRDDLQSARDKLKKTSYYTHWTNEYLKEILSQ